MSETSINFYEAMTLYEKGWCEKSLAKKYKTTDYQIAVTINRAMSAKRRAANRKNHASVCPICSDKIIIEKTQPKGEQTSFIVEM